MNIIEQVQALKNAYVMEYTENHKINSENIKEELNNGYNRKNKRDEK